MEILLRCGRRASLTSAPLGEGSARSRRATWYSSATPTPRRCTRRRRGKNPKFEARNSKQIRMADLAASAKLENPKFEFRNKFECSKENNSKRWHREMSAGQFAHPVFRALLLSSFGFVSDFDIRTSGLPRGAKIRHSKSEIRANANPRHEETRNGFLARCPRRSSPMPFSNFGFVSDFGIRASSFRLVISMKNDWKRIFAFE